MAVHPSNTSRRGSREHDGPSATTGLYGWLATISATVRAQRPLDELAAAGVAKFRLIRLFRDWTGLPPHALQVAHRIRVARRMLEANQTIAETAAATGFADQSHLHRHFQRSLGLTPGEYQTRFRD